MSIKVNLHKLINRFMIVTGIVFLSIIACTLFMILVYSIPINNTKVNVERSFSLYSNQMIDNWIGEKEALYASLSNFTDSIMLNNALSRPYDSTIQNAMLNPRTEFSNSTSMIENLLHIIDDEGEEVTYVDYARYWHGYLLYLIPLLQFFSVGEIKMIILVIQLFLFVFAIILIGRKDVRYSIAFAGTVLFINPVTTVLTFQEADIYIITLFFMIILIISNQEKAWWIFVINGICVAFFDFFTYPLVALGLPLLCSIILSNHHSMKEKVKGLMEYTFCWGYGFLGMWFGKWVVGTILTRRNILEDGFASALYRIGGEAVSEAVDDVSYGYIMKSIFRIVCQPPMVISMVLTIVIIVCFGIYTRKKKLNNKVLNKVTFSFYEYLPLIIVAFYPFIYFFIVQNHSAVHPWLAYRELSITVFAFNILIIRIQDDILGWSV